MSTKAQISVTKGKTTVRVFVDHDGYPENVLSTLKDAAKKQAHAEPLDIAYAIVKGNPDWDLSIIAGDQDEGSINYHYRVEVLENTWSVTTTDADEVNTAVIKTKPFLTKKKTTTAAQLTASLLKLPQDARVLVARLNGNITGLQDVKLMRESGEGADSKPFVVIS